MQYALAELRGCCQCAWPLQDQTPYPSPTTWVGNTVPLNYSLIFETKSCLVLGLPRAYDIARDGVELWTLSNARITGMYH